ncbi:MAG: DNA polymerase I [Chitinophagales bacterium]
MKTLYLLDAYALIFRAYYSMGNNFLYNSKKLNVTAIMGFTRALWQLIQRENPSHLAIVFDHKSANVRVQEFEYYKAQRDATPEDIIISEPYIRRIIEAMHIPILEVEGYEADDVIGTIAKQKARENHLVYMVTPDKDFGQLVEDNIKIYKPSRQGNQPEILGVEEICKNWEIDNPLQVIDILALWGDAVDNIPGIPGIGEKTAKALIKEFGSVENLIANSDKLKGKQKENVINFAQQGLDSKKLATIIIDVPIEIGDEKLIIEPFDKDTLREIFTELEFRTLQKEILGETVSNSPPKTATGSGATDLFNQTAAEEVVISSPFENINTTPHNYHLVESDQEFENLLTQLKEENSFAFDTETTGLDFNDAEIVGISFTVKKGSGFYVPLSSNFNEAKEQLHRFQDIFLDESKLKIAQNFKFDLHILKTYGIEIAFPIYDTMLCHFLLDADAKHGLDAMAQRYLNYDTVKFEELVGKGVRKISIRDVSIEKLKDYAAEDTDIAFQLYENLNSELTKIDRLEDLAKKVEFPLIYVLADMERKGVSLDTDFLHEYSKELAIEQEKFQEAIFEEAGVRFNLDSPKQLGEVLFDKMKIPYTEKKTKTGQYATGEEVLSKLKKEHNIAKNITEYRELTKLKSTYVDALPQLIHPKTGRIHTSFNQTIASTGRLSSTEPNLQNIPIRTERGRKIRKAFNVPNEDYVLLSADYSQIELRVIAAMSGDETMIEAFKQNQDIHKLTASKVYGIPFEDVTKEQRSNAKVVNFGIIYGVSAFGLSQQTTLTMAEAKDMIQNYFKTYPRIKEYMDGQIKIGQEKGYVETILGRRRYLRDINSRNAMHRGIWERIAINAPIQGSAADMIKLAMLDIHQKFKDHKLESAMTLQVHDELVFEVYKPELEKVKDIVIFSMENAISDLPLPIVAEFGTGINWLEAH